MEPYLIDQRGREVYEFAPLGVPCQGDGCGNEAVRHQCNAHGFPFVTHVHGGIHPLDGTKHAKNYCEDCGRAVQRFNDTTIRANKYLSKGGWR